VKDVEPPGADSSHDLLARQPAPAEFVEGEDAPLLGGELRDPYIGSSVAFVPSTGTK
jgi:hypothetical protein